MVDAGLVDIGSRPVFVAAPNGHDGYRSTKAITPLDARPPSVATFPARTGAVADAGLTRRLYYAADLACAIAILAAILLTANTNGSLPGTHEFLAMRVTVKNVLLLGVFCVGWIASFSAFGLYDRAVMPWRIVAACTLGSVAALLFPMTTHNIGALRYDHVLVFWAAASSATVLERIVIRRTRDAIRSRAIRRILIIGSGPRAVALARQLRNTAPATCTIIGFVDTREADAEFGMTNHALGYLDQLEQTLMHTVVDEVLIALPIKSHYCEIEKAIRACEHVGVQSKYLADVFDPSLARPRLEVRGRFPLMAMPVVADDYRLRVKRITDVLAVLATAPITVTVSLVIALVIKLTSSGPALFVQNRYGRDKRIFRMYKFRTMVTGAEALQAALEHRNEANGPVFKIKGDPRVTGIGRFLRKSSLDELPQLWNVLRGEMSLVGPRPLSLRDVHRFTDAWLMRRFSVRPGLTCLWQISGRSDLSFERWVALDLEYIDRWSLGLDMRILWRTVPAVLKGTGAS